MVHMDFFDSYPWAQNSPEPRGFMVVSFMKAVDRETLNPKPET